MALELLAPAKNVDQGILAFRCGADAVYMGGARFGARQGATCEMADFERLCTEARLWGARVYATLNTVLFEEELEEARRMAWQLFEAGVDALIIQDMALLEMDLPPLPLHASTQAACDSPEKVAFLASAGLTRAILARELSLAEIRAIQAAADIELEAFVFGALCVSESGRCYLSGAICDRSGNRGACAQPCRAPWNLLDASGRTLLRDKHLLSIQDLDLSGHLEELADAGITSFKIEGRLKDADYVKNVVSHLRARLDDLLTRRPELGRASLGRVGHAFTADPAKTFQRGLGAYRLDGERRPMGTPEAAGHLGEPIGTVRSVQGDRVLVDRDHDLRPGDGLAFVPTPGEVAGTSVNAVDGRQVFVQDPSRLRPGIRLFRNVDHAFLKTLRAAKVERRIGVRASLSFPEGEARLVFTDESGMSAEATLAGDFAPARDPAATERTTLEALGKLGDTVFRLEGLDLAEPRFVPVSRLNALRREAAERLETARRLPRPREGRRSASPIAPPEAALDFRWNVTNSLARAFYERLGAKVVEAAPEAGTGVQGRVVMTTRHCLRYELGWCAIHPNDQPWAHLLEPQGPLYLENGPTRLRCTFDCARCRMELVLE